MRSLANLRYSVLVMPQLEPRLRPRRLARGVPHQDKRGRTPLPRGHVDLVGVHCQARDNLEKNGKGDIGRGRGYIRMDEEGGECRCG